MDKNKQIRILTLTNISHGTLLTCCRQSTIFNSISASYEQLDHVRKQWRKFLEASSHEFQTWVDAWLAFTHFKQRNRLVR